MQLTLISQTPRAGERGCDNFLMRTDPDSCMQGSEGVYARECAARPGFSMSFSDPGASRTSFSDYRRLCAKWQHTITSGLRAALQSKNYVQTRNAFLILNTTVKARTFPTSSNSSKICRCRCQGRLRAAGRYCDLAAGQETRLSGFLQEF